jgi:hypothetical protein
MDFHSKILDRLEEIRKMEATQPLVIYQEAPISEEFEEFEPPFIKKIVLNDSDSRVIERIQGNNSILGN